MAGQMFARGDRVKVTLEGEVTRVLDIEPGSEEVELRVEHNGRASYVYTDMATVEKVEPPVEVFGPGDVVRDRVYHNLVYTLGSDGYYSHRRDVWRANGSPDHWKAGPFTSESYERVSVG